MTYFLVLFHTEVYSKTEILWVYYFIIDMIIDVWHEVEMYSKSWKREGQSK